MSRDPWQTIWQVGTSRELLLALLLAIAVGLAISAGLPQLSPTDSVAYAQKLSEARARFGDATATMQQLGLFNITRSFGFRALMALLAACLSLRMIDNIQRLLQSQSSRSVETARDNDSATPYPENASTSLRWPSEQVAELLAHVGGLLILIGLLLTYLWGWHIEDVTLQPGSPTLLDATQKWVALESDNQTVRHSPGIRSVVTAEGPGFQVSATDESGQALEITETSTSSPTASLTLALSEDRYFAIPSARLVFRLSPQADTVVGSPDSTLVQVYRSPPGKLIQERIVENTTDLTVDNVTLHLVSVPYVQVDVSFTPGSWPIGFGMALLITGIVFTYRGNHAPGNFKEGAAI